MPKPGLDYSISRQKRRFDLLLANALRPAASMASVAIMRSIDTSAHPELDTIYKQLRIGKGEEPFMIYKYQTLDPDTLLPLGRLAGIMRRLALDELAQLKNVREGTMSMCSYRPLIISEYEEVMDHLPPRLQPDWKQTVTTRKPGGASSYATHHHLHPIPDANEYELRAELDIYDGAHDSLPYNLQVITNLCIAAAQRRFL